MPQFDVLCVGNATIDSFLTLHEVNSSLRYNKDTNELCIKFGQKIGVEKAEVALGGDAANVAVGLSRLGVKSAIVAEIGKDEFAEKIINGLLKENVDTSKTIQTEGQQSSFSTIISFNNERTIFSEHVKRNHNFNFDNIASRWIYLTSLGEEWKNAYEKTLNFAKNNNCKFAFNPGTLQIESGKENLSNILNNTDLLFLNKDEAEKILNIKYEISNMNLLLADLQKMGPKIVIVTDGKNGSFAIDSNGKFLKKGVIESPVVEKTGAGDAYSSGFLGALISGKTIEEAMDWGTKNAASVIGKVGAQNGLLYKSDLL